MEAEKNERYQKWVKGNFDEKRLLEGYT
jgi:hypothetical protein